MRPTDTIEIPRQAAADRYRQHVVNISKRLGPASPTITREVDAHLFKRREDKGAEAINQAVASLLSV